MRIRPGFRKNETGFTMVEVMVVIGIIAILATAAIPGFSLWLPDYRLKGAVQDLYSNMQLAKMEAIKTNGTRSVVFTPGSGQYTKADGTQVILSDYGSGTVFGDGDATQGVGGENFDDYVTYSTPDNEVSFNSRGMCDNSGYVYLTNEKGTAYAVGSLTSGVVILRKWNGSAWE
jgi:prepilin-type N-terminal cleavage/methylation domain-containing protein